MLECAITRHVVLVHDVELLRSKGEISPKSTSSTCLKHDPSWYSSDKGKGRLFISMLQRTGAGKRGRED
eukprot:525212-Hanusia_phi.AAC.2